MEQSVNVQRAMTKLVLSQGFYAAMIMSSPLTPRSDIPTAATDGHAIFYNPDWLGTMPPDHIIFVLAHEVEHIVRLHCLRRGSRNPMLWNAAADHRINLDLINAGLKGPVDEHGRFMGLADHKYLNDAKWSAEAIYRDIESESGGGGDGGGDGNSPGEQEGRGSGGMPKTPSGADNIFDGDVMEPTGEDGEPLTAQEQDELDRVVRGRILTAVAQAKAKKDIGAIPAHLRGLLAELTQPKVDWRHELREFVRATSSEDTSWNRLNRRVRHRGLKLPSLHSEKVGGLGIILDTSGSCHQEIVPCLSEVVGIAAMVKPERIVVLFIDTHIQAEVITDADNFEADMGDLLREPPMGGGTNLIPAFQRLEELGDFDAVICLTDLWTPWPESFEFGDVTLFVDTDAGDKVEPFGRKVAYTRD